jgi:hypothetical protein
MSAIVHLATGTMGSNASVTISSIPQTSKDLILLIRAGVNTTIDELAIRPNNHSSGNYSYRAIRNANTSQGTTAGLTAVTGTSEIYYRGGFISGSTAGEPYMSVHEYHIPNYAGTTNKIMTYVGGIPAYRCEVRGHLLRQTAAITSLVLGPVSGNVFLHGTTYSLYGVG